MYISMAEFIKKYYSIIFVIFVVAIIAVSFALGYQVGDKGAIMDDKQIVFSCPSDILDKQRISSSSINSTSSVAVNTSTQTQRGGAYMGSKNGTKYYTPDCPGSKRIKAENIIWFQSVQDATLQGYSKGSC